MQYPSMNTAIKSHIAGMTKVHNWLKVRRADMYHPNYRFNNNLILRANHVNNYIECGPAYDDPKDIHWYVWTEEDYEFRVKMSDLSDMLESIRAHQFLGDKRIANNIEIHTDVNNPYTMQKHLILHGYRESSVVLNIKFRIYLRKPSV